MRISVFPEIEEFLVMFYGFGEISFFELNLTQMQPMRDQRVDAGTDVDTAATGG